MYREVSVLVALVGISCASLLDGDIDLLDGVRLARIPVTNSLEDEGRSFGENSPLFRMAKFLEGHELHVKLPNLIEKDRVTQFLADSLKVVDDSYKENSGEYCVLLQVIFRGEFVLIISDQIIQSKSATDVT